MSKVFYFIVALVVTLLTFYLLLNQSKDLMFSIFQNGYEKGYGDGYAVSKHQHKLTHEQLGAVCMFHDYEQPNK